MRKLLIYTLVISLILFFITPQSFAECECDLNGDGSCNGLDWLLFAPDWGRTDCPDRIESPIPVTGQVTSYEVGDDGHLQMGVQWPDPRFTDNGDGTVTDHLTGLIWLKIANCFGPKKWTHALGDANGLASGSCGLTDGSIAGDWRLPNVRELHSLIDYGKSNPALPSGHPFTAVAPSYYWSSTNSPDVAWGVGVHYGFVDRYNKDDYKYVWPVRGGN